MTLLEIILSCSCLVLGLLLIASVYFNVKHGIMLIKLTESIEDTLDVLDTSYGNISKVLEIPLFFDSPQIRSVVTDLRTCRDSLLQSAQILTEEIQQEENEEKTDN